MRGGSGRRNAGRGRGFSAEDGTDAKGERRCNRQATCPRFEGPERERTESAVGAGAMGTRGLVRPLEIASARLVRTRSRCSAGSALRRGWLSLRATLRPARRASTAAFGQQRPGKNAESMGAGAEGLV